MDTGLQWANFWVNVVLAVITLLAVAVAMFGRWYWDERNKPQILFKVGNEKPHKIQSDGLPLAWYFRLETKNTGKTVAKNCYIKINSVLLENGGSIDYFEPDRLKWSSSPRDMRYRENPKDIAREKQDKNIPNLSPIFREREDIAPLGGWELCDLFWTKGDGTFTFISKGRRPTYWIREGNYIVEIEIFGDNIEPIKRKFRIYSTRDFPLVAVEPIKNISQ